MSAEARRALRARGAPVAWWTADTRDALRPEPSAAPLLEAVERARGGVVLMHDFDRDPPEPERERFVVDVSAALLELAARRGWRVTTVGTLLRGRPARRPLPVRAHA
jgi:hypothetical protein